METEQCLPDLTFKEVQILFKQEIIAERRQKLEQGLKGKVGQLVLLVENHQELPCSDPSDESSKQWLVYVKTYLKLGMLQGEIPILGIIPETVLIPTDRYAVCEDIWHEIVAVHEEAMGPSLPYWLPDDLNQIVEYDIGYNLKRIEIIIGEQNVRNWLTRYNQFTMVIAKLAKAIDYDLGYTPALEAELDRRCQPYQARKNQLLKEIADLDAYMAKIKNSEI